ncbi:MAG: type II secretion system protein GspM [Pseudomonadota bacterium]
MNRLDTLNARRKLWWSQLAPREQRMVAIALTLIVLALLWWVALAPALRTLTEAPAAHAQLDAQLQQMTTLQAQAKSLQGQPRVNRDDALQALDTAVRQNLGPNAQMQPTGAGEGVTINVRAAPADGIAQWLAQARGNARAVPREVHLTRSPNLPTVPTAPAAGKPATAAPASASASAPATDTPRAPNWDGTVVMSLPAR